MAISDGELLATTDAAKWANAFVERFGGGDIDFGLMVGWFANAIETGRTASDSDHRRLVGDLRYIAQSCDHAPNLKAGQHIHEPTTGGERFCGPCHAWRVLNGSPFAVDSDDDGTIEAMAEYRAQSQPGRAGEAER